MKKALKIFERLPMWAFGEGAIAFCVCAICEAIIKIMPETTKVWGIANFLSPIAFWLGVAGGCVCFVSPFIHSLLIAVDETTK